LSSAKPAYRFIAIEGNIGAGKTTLVSRLTADFNARAIFEEFEDNSFLPKFYSEPRRYAFPLEMSFLASRFNQLKKQLSEQGLFDDLIFSDYIFAKCLLFSKVNLDDDEYDLYMKLFEIINLQLPQPELLIYLHNPIEKLQWNIANRGRSYEQNISDEYLQQLNDRYNEYFRANTNMRIVIIDCSSLDFANNEDHYQNIKAQLCKEYSAGIHYINWLIES